MADGILIGKDYLEFKTLIINFNMSNRQLFTIDKRDKVQISYVDDCLKIISDGTFLSGNIVVKINKDLSKYSTMKLKIKDVLNVQIQSGYEPRFGVMRQGITVNSNGGAFQNGFFASTVMKQGITEYTVNIGSFSGLYDIGIFGEFSATIVDIRLEE